MVIYMRVFCVSASRNKRSVGAALAKQLEKNFNDIGVETKFYIGEDFDINFCAGCSTCFAQGICPLDDTDGFDDIKKYILKTELIIIISPVYAYNVSGVIKNFIDRISYWFHVLKLSGKMGIVISIADDSGAEFVGNYLEKVLTCCGCNVIGKYNIIKTQSNMILEKIVDNIYKDAMMAIENKEQYHSTEILEKQFQNLKREYIQYKNVIIDDIYEVKYWYTSGIIECSSFKEWIQKSLQRSW